MLAMTQALHMTPEETVWLRRAGDAQKAAPKPQLAITAAGGMMPSLCPTKRQSFVHRWLANWAVIQTGWTLIVSLWWIVTREQMAAGAFVAAVPVLLAIISAALLTRRWRNT